MNPNSSTELDLRKMDAQGSKRSYGPDSMDGWARERERRSRCVQTLVDDDYFDEEKE
ncbi:unnamed protein product [marine sediment metagenome]|uniref:Uncharacterized protein n=1 Tax=marine sediment metagenome TaxID=412755 RepID=X1BFE4_9ZZZZ